MGRKPAPTPPAGAPEALRSRAFAKSEAIKAELRRLVRAHPLSEREITRRLGYSPAYLTNLLGSSKGREPATLRLDTYLALAEVLEIDALGFLGSVLEQEQTQGANRERGVSELELTLRRLEEQLRARTVTPKAMSSEDEQALVDASLGLVRVVATSLGRDEGGETASGS